MNAVSPQAHYYHWIDRWLFPLSFALVILVYFFTAPRGITWLHFGTDGGELITASMTGGVPHPTGYAPYMLLSRLFAVFPIGQNVAHRYNLFSSLCMALAAAQIYFLIVYPAQGSPAWGSLLMLSWAFTPLVWSQALIAEVYALNLFFVSSGLSFGIYLYLSNRTNGGTEIFLFGLLIGLAALSHLTSLFLFLFVALVLFRLYFQKGAPFYTLILFGLGGLLPIVISVILFYQRALGDSPIVWGNLSQAGNIWWIMSGSLYRANLLRSDFSEIVQRVTDWSITFFYNWTWVGWLPIALLSFSELEVSSARRWPALTLLLTAALYFTYGLTYGTPDALVFTMPAMLMLCVGFGLLHDSAKRINPWYILLPICLLLINLPTFRDSDVEEIVTTVNSIFEELPEEAVALTDGQDKTIFTLWYFHYVEERRPDIVLVDQNLMAFDWYRERVARLYPQIKGLEEDNVSQFIEENRQIGALCKVSSDPASVDCIDDD
ncbi:MAG: DUF2723 domain-containing protein [Chloroflexota bacterium]